MNTTNTIIDTASPGTVCSNAGALITAEVASNLNIAESINSHLGPIAQAHLPYSAGDALTAMAMAITAGADCTDDINLPARADRATADPTRAMHTMRPKVHQRLPTAIGAGTDDNPTIIDIDATLIDIHSNKEKAAPTFTRGFSFHPLLAIIDHGPGIGGEPMAGIPRPGNADSNTAADHIDLIALAYRSLVGSEKAGHTGHRAMVRTDTAGESRKVIEYLHKRGFTYSLGFAMNEKIAQILPDIDAASKYPVIRPNEPGGVTDIDTA